jgi:hypothetical protein
MAFSERIGRTVSSGVSTRPNSAPTKPNATV